MPGVKSSVKCGFVEIIIYTATQLRLSMIIIDSVVDSGHCFSK